MVMSLNRKQIKAVNAKEDNVLIIAPAGSGKTTTLVEAIKKYKIENPADKVVAITFTRKASADLNSRLRGFDNVLTSTIHSWALQELDNLSMDLMAENPNSGFKVKLLQEEKIKEILKDLLKRRRYFYIKVDILYSYIMGNYNMDINMKMRSMFEAIFSDYAFYKDKHGLYDFTDLPKYLLDKLNDYGRDIEHIDALFVDEFQDVDDTQLELFERVIAKKKFFIGDPKQSIYIFRGASEDVMNKLKGFKLYSLDVNYRSHQEIVDFATTFQDKASQEEGLMFSAQIESYQSSILCENGVGGNVYVLNRKGFAYKVNEYIKKDGLQVVKDFLKTNPMILCRKNKEVREIKALGYDKVQTIHQAKGLEYPSVIVTDFEIGGIEDINISYVAMTRAEKDLLAANYSKLIEYLEKIGRNSLIGNRLF